MNAEGVRNIPATGNGCLRLTVTSRSQSTRLQLQFFACATGLDRPISHVSRLKKITVTVTVTLFLK
jgi:hypothetical protein